MVLTQIVQGLLFAIFAVLTSTLQFVLGPTYNDLLVPELRPGALYPALLQGGGFFGSASAFSQYVLLRLVDPAVPLVALVLGVLYLARAAVPELAAKATALVPRLVVAVVLANFALPVAAAILGVAASGYPVLATFDGGAWQTWQNLAGPGMLQFSWDNGALAFVLTLVLFTLVMLLVLAVALRDALLAVLAVLLPLLTLLYPVPTLAPLARRAWLLFGQLAFLPWLVVVPLELAVGAGSAPLLVGYLTVALSAPVLLALGGASLSGLGFPAAGSAVAGSVQRGLALGGSAVGSLVAPFTRPLATLPSAANAVRGATRNASGGSLPLALPAFTGEMLGQGAARLFRHLPDTFRRDGAVGSRYYQFPAVRRREEGP